MSTVARHKRPGGFRKLVNALETTAPEKREKILETMRREDPDFIAEVENSIFEFDEFLNMNDMLLGEVIDAMKAEPRSIALALYHADQTLVDKFTKNMKPPQAYEFKELSGALSNVLERERTSARYRIIAKARELEGRGSFMLKKYSPAYDTN